MKWSSQERADLIWFTVVQNRVYRSSTNVDDVDQCAICLNPLLARSTDPDKQTVKLNCNHEFHRECIQKWASQQEKQINDLTCPLCRKDFKMTDTLIKKPPSTIPTIDSTNYNAIDAKHASFCKILKLWFLTNFYPNEPLMELKEYLEGRANIPHKKVNYILKNENFRPFSEKRLLYPCTSIDTYKMIQEKIDRRHISEYTILNLNGENETVSSFSYDDKLPEPQNIEGKIGWYYIFVSGMSPIMNDFFTELKSVHMKCNPLPPYYEYSNISVNAFKQNINFR
tara:strand:+ start:1316 stop:2164 length:849 start_codon:yes stop_codon:yes gene_type:complete